MAKQDQNKLVRKLLHDIGADRVIHRQDDSWHALWYNHPRNHASNGEYVLIGDCTMSAIAYLSNYNTYCWEQLRAL